MPLFKKLKGMISLYPYFAYIYIFSYIKRRRINHKNKFSVGRGRKYSGGDDGNIKLIL